MTTNERFFQINLTSSTDTGIFMDKLARKLEELNAGTIVDLSKQNAHRVGVIIDSGKDKGLREFLRCRMGLFNQAVVDYSVGPVPPGALQRRAAVLSPAA